MTRPAAVTRPGLTRPGTAPVLLLALLLGGAAGLAGLAGLAGCSGEPATIESNPDTVYADEPEE